MPTYEKSGAGDDSLVRVLTGYSTESKKKILKKVQTRGKKFKVGEFEVVGVTDVVVDVYISEPDREVSVFDSTTPVEDLEIDPFILAGIDVYDDTTPTEFVETAQGSFVDVFDSVTPTDVVDDLIVTEDYDISVYDEAGVTENIETAQESFIDVYDQPSVTDVVDGILRVYTIDEFDSTGVTESIETAQESFIDVYDQPAVTDVITDIVRETPVADLTIDVFDSTTVQESVSVDAVWVFAFIGSGSGDSQYIFGRNARSDLDSIYTLTGDWEEVRVIIEAHSAQDTPVRGMAIGRKGAVDPDYFPDEWIRFLFDAAETTTVPAGTEIASDWMLFPIRGARDYWLHVKWLQNDYGKAGAYLNCYRKTTDVDETEIEDVSGYAFSGFGSNVIKYLEVRKRTHIVDEWETVTVTDVVTDVQFTQPSLEINIQEPVITLVEDVTVDPLIIPGIDVYDEPGVTDFVEMGQGSFVDVYDQPSVTDIVVGILRVYTIDEFDTTGVTDVVEMGQGSFIDVYDAATPVENVDIDPLILAGIDEFDTAGVTDVIVDLLITALAPPEINVYDETTPVESVDIDPLILAGIDVFDEAAVTEQVETAQVSFIDVWDATTPTDVVDDLIVSEDYDISVYDETGVTESVETAQESFIDVWDQPSVTDVVVGILKVFTISEFDSTAVQESVATAQESFIDAWDTAGVTDVVDGVNVLYDPYEIDVYDITTPSDVLVGVTIPDAALEISEFDQTGITESVSTAQESFIDAWDGVTATDIVDGVDISAAIHEIDVFDQAGVTEDVTVDPLVIPGVDVFDSVAVTEFQETSLSSPGLSVFDSVAVTEDITPRIHLPLSVVDTTAVSESVAAKASDLAVDLSDSVAVADVVQALIPVDLDISVFDSAAVTDVVVSLSIVFAADVSALGPWFKGRTTSVTFKSRECNITFSTVKKAA